MSRRMVRSVVSYLCCMCNIRQCCKRDSFLAGSFGRVRFPLAVLESNPSRAMMSIFLKSPTIASMVFIGAGWLDLCSTRTVCLYLVVWSIWYVLRDANWLDE
jgi:hypothetical protein